MASGRSEEIDQVCTVAQFDVHQYCSLLELLFSWVFSFTFAGDMFVPVEDAHPLESLLMHETQVRNSSLTQNQNYRLMAFMCWFL